MVVGHGQHTKARVLQPFNHPGISAERVKMMKIVPGVGDGTLEVGKGEIGGAKHGSDLAKRIVPVLPGLHHRADVSGQHHVTDEEQGTLLRRGPGNGNGRLRTGKGRSSEARGNQGDGK